MASTEGPTAAITQAVNLSVSENVNKVQSEPLPLSSNSNEKKTNDASESVQTTLSDKAPSKPEADHKPATEAVTADDKVNETPATNEPIAPTVNNSTPNIPAPPLTQDQNMASPADKSNAKPPNGDSNGPQPTAKQETTEVTKDAPKAATPGEAAKTEEVAENLSQPKAPEGTQKDETTPDQSSNLSVNASENITNCENKVLAKAQDTTSPSDGKESNKPSVDSQTKSAPNGGSSMSATASIPDSAPAQSSPVSKPVATIKPMVESMDTSVAPEDGKPNVTSSVTKPSNKRPAEDSDEPDKRLKTTSPAHPSSSGFKGKTPEQTLEYMEKTFNHRRKIITKQMPTIPELKDLYPDLFRDKQLVIEFQRLTKIDIDQKIQEFCVRNATAVIEMARKKNGAQPVLARWEQAKQENETLKQYWDMVTALCLLPLHFGENFVEMVLEIGEDEEVQAQGKIVPTLVARGNIFRTDEFFLIAENTIVQEFEEFTIAFASLYSSYWVFNMVYPETIENTYNFIQRCIVKQKEPGAIPTVCKNFTKTLQKWNKSLKKT